MLDFINYVIHALGSVALFVLLCVILGFLYANIKELFQSPEYIVETKTSSATLQEYHSTSSRKKENNFPFLKIQIKEIKEKVLRPNSTHVWRKKYRIYINPLNDTEFDVCLGKIGKIEETIYESE